MSDRRDFGATQRQPIERAAQQQRRAALKQNHPLRLAREGALAIEGIARLAALAEHRRRIEGAVAMLDVGALGHADKQLARPVVLQHRARRPDERLVDIVLRDRGCDSIQVCGGHGCSRPS